MAPNIMWLVVAAVLSFLWAVGFIVYRMASSLIHLLLVIGVGMLALHFLRR